MATRLYDHKCLEGDIHPNADPDTLEALLQGRMQITEPAQYLDLRSRGNVLYQVRYTNGRRSIGPARVLPPSVSVLGVELDKTEGGSLVDDNISEETQVVIRSMLHALGHERIFFAYKCRLAVEEFCLALEIDRSNRSRSGL